MHLKLFANILYCVVYMILEGDFKEEFKAANWYTVGKMKITTDNLPAPNTDKDGLFHS